MKKKIGDFTLREMKQICDSRFRKGHPYCTKCPLYQFCSLSPDDIEQRDLDLEIEVQENE